MLFNIWRRQTSFLNILGVHSAPEDCSKQMAREWHSRAFAIIAKFSMRDKLCFELGRRNPGACQKLNVLQLICYHSLRTVTAFYARKRGALSKRWTERQEWLKRRLVFSLFVGQPILSYVQCGCAPRGSLCQAALRINFSIAPGSWRLHEILAISLSENIFPQESQELLCRCATVPRAFCRFFKNPSSGDNWCPLFVTRRPPFLKWRSLNTKQCLWSSIKVKQAWRSQSLLAEGPKSWAKGPKNQTEEAKSWPEGP